MGSNTNWIEFANNASYLGCYFKASNNPNIDPVSLLDTDVNALVIPINGAIIENVQLNRTLQNINDWSNVHPDHLPITLFLEVKDDKMVHAANISDGNLVHLNGVLKNAFGNKIFKPTDIMNYQWPLVKDLHNRIIIVLSGNSQVRSKYYWEKEINNPAVAVNDYGRVLVVYNQQNYIKYWTGQYQNDGTIQWHHTGKICAGNSPAVILNNVGIALMVFESQKELFYTVGLFQNTDIIWKDPKPYDTGITPALSLQHRDGFCFVEIHRSENTQFMWGHVGRLDLSGNVYINPNSKNSKQVGFFPSIRYHNNRWEVVYYPNERDDSALEMFGDIYSEQIHWNKKEIKQTSHRSFKQEAFIKHNQGVRVRINNGALQYETDKEIGLVRPTQICFVDFLPETDLMLAKEAKKQSGIWFASANANSSNIVSFWKNANKIVRLWSYNDFKQETAVNPNFAATDEPLSQEYHNHFLTFWNPTNLNMTYEFPETKLQKVKDSLQADVHKLKQDAKMKMDALIEQYLYELKMMMSQKSNEIGVNILDDDLQAEMLRREANEIENLKQQFMERSGIVMTVDQRVTQAKEARQRQYIVKEILTSEADYQKTLYTLIQHFYHPLKQLKADAIASEKELGCIFLCIEELYGYSKLLLSKLEEKVKDFSVKETIADAFLELAQIPNFSAAFSAFVNNHPIALKTYRECMTRPNFQNFVKKSFMDIHINLTIPDLLIAPLHRIVSYELLLDKLLKATNPGHADYNKLTQALDFVRAMNADIDNQKKIFENKQKVHTIQQKIERAPSLVQPDRYFVREGPLMTMKTPKDTLFSLPLFDMYTYIFLFNDALVITHKRTAASFVFRELIPVTTRDTVKQTTMNELAGFVITKEDGQKHEFYAQTAEDCTSWIMSIESLVRPPLKISRSPDRSHNL